MSPYSISSEARRRSLGVVLALFVGGGCAPKPEPAQPAQAQAGGEGTPAPAARPKKLEPRAALPPAVREALSASMERHGEELTFLLAAVVLLHYDDVVELADMIADEPKLGRPLPGDHDSLNALLPTAFFDYQDKLTAQARELSAVAREKDAEAAGRLLGGLTETCVGCHAAYLQDELTAEPAAPSPTADGE